MLRTSQLTIVLLLAVVITPKSYAGPCPGSIRNDFKKNLAQQISIIGKVDNRQTYANYGRNNGGLTEKQVEKKFGATGYFFCDDKPTGTANLTVRNDVLTLASHSLYERDKNGVCRAWAKDFSKCYFRPIDGQGHLGEHFEIDASTIKMPKQCPLQGEIGLDWAVVKLKKPVPGVRPYPVYDLVANGESLESLTGRKITVVAGPSKGFEGGKLPSICSTGQVIQIIRGVPEGRILAHDCSSSPGGSGSAILMEDSDGKLEFIGLSTGASDSKWDYQPLGRDNFSGGPLFQGDFYKTLAQLSGSN